MKRWLAVAALFTATQAWAAADIEGRVEFPNGTFIAPGSFATARLIIKNNGPDFSDGATMGSVYFGTVGIRTIELVASPETAPCLVQYTIFIPPPVPPRPATVAAGVQTLLNGLAPGESFTCVVAIGTYPEAAANLRVRFGFQPTVDDPNLANNEVFVNIQTRTEPMAVPTLSWIAQVVLLIGLLFIGMARSNERR
jgi:hypothetical protein